MKRVAFVIVCGALILAASRGSAQTITQEELVRRTQELMDSISEGDPTPWKKYYADDALFFDEKGRKMDKAALVNDITPLPAGYSGNIKVMNAQGRMFSDTAILSYDADETETVYGQNMTARYHSTDTWLRRGGQWQIVASQTLRYYEDPAPGKTDPARFKEYVGTYELAPKVKMVVSADGEKLYAQRGDRPKDLLIPEAPDVFFRKGEEGRRIFRRDQNGKVDALILRRNNEDIVWKKVN